jgi:hypothetical protein
MLVVDISTLRLVVGDENMKIVIRWPGIEEPIVVPLLKVLMENPTYNWGYTASEIQRDLDRQDEWEIVFYITKTYITVATVNVDPWHIVKQDAGIGGIMQ